MQSKLYVTAHLKKTELQALEELCKLTGRRKHDIVNEAVKNYLRPYVKDRDKAFRALKEKYTPKEEIKPLN